MATFKPTPVHKSASASVQGEGQAAMARQLGPVQLTLLGIGAIVGTGVFVLSGQVAAAHTGPAVTLAFALAGLCAMLAALCYSELASMVSRPGSAYAYARVALGEVAAWCMGWALLLEYALAAASVGVGWSAYLVAFFHNSFGWQLSPLFSHAPLCWDAVDKHLVATGAVVNVPAAAIVFALTCVVALSTGQAARFNAAAVAVKMAVILCFMVCAGLCVRTANFHPYLPANTGAFGRFGWTGLLQGTSILFFAYNGFDAISTAAPEARCPQRDIPVAIVASVAVAAAVYVGVAAALTGVVPYSQLAVPHPLSVGLATTGATWLQPFVELGALAGLTSVILVNLYSQPRIACAMAQDGLLPPAMGRIHPKSRTPLLATVLNGAGCTVCAALLPIDVLGELMCAGTLFAFMLVSLGTLVLRYRRPQAPRAFRVPGPACGIPLLSTCLCTLLLAVAQAHTLKMFALWLGLGLALYFGYGRRAARLCRQRQQRRASL
jgi:APA family basic amino acid/polyamine antiporter